MNIYNIYYRPWYHLVHMSRLLFLFHYSISIPFLLEHRTLLWHSDNGNSTCRLHFHNRVFHIQAYPCSPRHNHFPIFSHIKHYLCPHTTKSPIKKELISLSAFFFWLLLFFFKPIEFKNPKFL